MIEIELETDAGGGVFRSASSADELLEVVRSMLWFPDDAEPVDGGVRATPRCLLMFLSDVRSRRFRRGVFLGPGVMAAAEAFRRAAAVVAAGRVLPSLGRGHARWLAVPPCGDAFADWCVDALMRIPGRSVLEQPAAMPFAVHDAWLAALRADDDRVVFHDAAAIAALERDLRVWSAPVRVSRGTRSSLCFSLVPPAEPDGTWRIDYPVPRTRLEFVSLGQAARLFPPLRSRLLVIEDAESFLRSGATVLVAAGYRVNVPPGLAGEHVSASLELDAGEVRRKNAVRPQVSAKIKVHVDGEVVTAREIEFLLDQGSSLVFFRNRWIEVDRFVLREALKALQGEKGGTVAVRDAVAFAVGARRFGRLRVDEVKAHGWLRGLVNELRGDERFAMLAPPKDLKVELRDYQLRGYSWLAFLAKWGFGACLADDMGLGKTVQTIAWILRRKEEMGDASGLVLVVSPVSVTANWMREFARFAPSLRVSLHQGPEREFGIGFRRVCRECDVVVTGYSLLVKDFNDFSQTEFAAVVLDEAQTVKNSDTRASRAARALDAPVRIALTGTPMENSPADLWSLQEFLNPGLLGSRSDFEAVFAHSIRTDAHSPAAVRLRRVLEPFMLRRLKTDPGVADELGAKREIREYCPLSIEQRHDYEAALDAYRADMAADSANRAGRILALLTELKLVCDGAGKMRRLIELLGDIFANGESVLVFTQYAKIGRMIRERLAEEFGRRFPFLHGSLSPREREDEIAAFNGAREPSAFILSLKAGGFGLNLTRATHVVHFDRWWNPAVENQATDRAHRIGQKSTVFVHVFICAGTLEDRIDELLEEKRRLAGELVGSGESFLMKMSDRELDNVLSLAPEKS